MMDNEHINWITKPLAPGSRYRKEKKPEKEKKKLFHTFIMIIRKFKL